MALAYSRRKTGLSIWKVTPVIIYMGINVAMHMKNIAPIMFCMSLRSGPFTCQNTAAAINPSTITWPTRALNTIGLRLIELMFRLQMIENCLQQIGFLRFVILISPSKNLLVSALVYSF